VRQKAAPAGYAGARTQCETTHTRTPPTETDPGRNEFPWAGHPVEECSRHMRNPLDNGPAGRPAARYSVMPEVVLEPRRPVGCPPANPPASSIWPRTAVLKARCASHHRTMQWPG